MIARLLLLVATTTATAQEPPTPPKTTEPEMIDDLEGLDNPGGEDLEGFEPDPDIAGLRIRSIRGHLETRFRTYLRERGGQGNDEQWFQRGELELDLDLGGELDAFVRPRFAVDAFDDELQRFELFEAYVDWRADDSDLRLGQFIENWGIADTFNPVDVLNRRDLAFDLLDPERLGELGVRYRRFFDGGDIIGEPMVSLYVMPVFRETEFPTEDSRWAFSPPGLTFDQDAAITPDGEDALFLAGRAQATVSTNPANADVQLVAARGPERTPTFQVTGPGQSLLAPVYYGSLVLGGGLRAVPNLDWWSQLTLKAEVVYKDAYRTSTGAPATLPDSYWSYAFGFDRLIPDVLLANDQLTMTIEYVGEAGADDFASDFRPFDDDVVGRLFWEANDFARTSAEVRAIVDVRSGETIGQAIFERQLRSLHEDLTGILDLQVFGRGSGKTSLFEVFPNNTSLTAALRLDF